jgi:hypothetical protein
MPRPSGRGGWAWDGVSPRTTGTSSTRTAQAPLRPEVRHAVRRLPSARTKETAMKATTQGHPQRPAAYRAALRDTSGGGRVAAHEPVTLTSSRSCPGPRRDRPGPQTPARMV